MSFRTDLVSVICFQAASIGVREQTTLCSLLARKRAKRMRTAMRSDTAPPAAPTGGAQGEAESRKMAVC